ncbi:MAG: DUF2325 domain-containing protein [Betaproteobacteria bacterium]
MTRRLAERSHRRLARLRPAPQRGEHGLDLALVDLYQPPPRDREGPAPADTRALRALAEENATLARELGRVQLRCTQWRDDCIAQAEHLEALLMRSRAESIVKETQMASLREALEALQKRAAVWLTNEELVRRVGDLRARIRTLETELAQARGTLANRAEPHDDAEPRLPAVDLRALALAGRLDDRGVLCVGGRARQMPVYQALVERRGGRFLHVDGADESSLDRLGAALDAADLVILQPGYVCQGACLAVERHCARRGTRCVQLDKACVQGFANRLAEAVALERRDAPPAAFSS